MGPMARTTRSRSLPPSATGMSYRPISELRFATSSGGLRRTTVQSLISLTATRGWWFQGCITLLVCIKFSVLTKGSGHKLVYVLPYLYAKSHYQVEKRKTVSLLGPLRPCQGPIAYCRAELSGSSGAGHGAHPCPTDCRCPPRSNAHAPHRADPGVRGLGAVLYRG